MKKGIILLLALVSLAVIGCSDSDDNTLASGIIGYETFSAAKNAWKEPTSYSYTAILSSDAVGSYMIDVKVSNGKSECTPNAKQTSWGTVEDILAVFVWNVKTIADLFESIEQENVYVKTDPILQADYKCCFIEPSFNAYGDKRFLSGVFCWGIPKRSGLVGGYGRGITITDFKVLEE